MAFTAEDLRAFLVSLNSQYERDEREPPDARRKDAFLRGWRDGARGALYSQDTLQSLTWQNLGSRASAALRLPEADALDAYEWFAANFPPESSARGPVAGEDWTEAENEALVSAYFDLLEAEQASAPLVKSHVNEELREGPISGRSRSSVEFKMRNVSSVMDMLGLPWVTGYRPAVNTQRSALEEIVLRIATERGAKGSSVAREVVESRAITDAAQAAEGAYAYRTGQSFSSDPATRRAVERCAVAQAKQHFQAEGFSVVEYGKPYDLKCTHPTRQELFVEVKGTASGAAEIFLTPNEVRFAREHANQMVLFIVCRIRISRDAEGRPVAEGGDKKLVYPWCPADDRLKVVTYAYALGES